MAQSKPGQLPALSPPCWFTLSYWAVFSAKEEAASAAPTLFERHHRPPFLPAAFPLPDRNWRESTAAWTRDSILRLSSPLALRFRYFQNLSFLGIVIIAYSHLTLNERDPVPSTLPGFTSLGGRYHKCSAPTVQMRKVRAKGVET